MENTKGVLCEDIIEKEVLPQQRKKKFNLKRTSDCFGVLMRTRGRMQIISRRQDKCKGAERSRPVDLEQLVNR